MRNVFVSAAALFLITACVTPLSPAQQAPSLQFSSASVKAASADGNEAGAVATNAPSKVLIAVVDSRVRTLEGKPENMIGFLRVYGIPNNWTINQLRLKDLPKDATLADLLENRLSTGLSNAGVPTVPVDVKDVSNGADVAAALQSGSADKLITLVLKDWHVDVNTSWVGKFQFNHDADLSVYDKSGKVFEKNFAEREVIQGEASDSWANMVLDAFREEMQEMLSAPEVQSALFSIGTDSEILATATEQPSESPAFTPET